MLTRKRLWIAVAVSVCLIAAAAFFVTSWMRSAKKGAGVEAKVRALMQEKDADSVRRMVAEPEAPSLAPYLARLLGDTACTSSSCPLLLI